MGSGKGYSSGDSGAASYATLQLYNGATGYTILNNQNYGINLQTASSTRLTILNGGNVGIGTTTPSQQLQITGNFALPLTTGTSPSGIIYKGTLPFISDFNYGNNGTTTVIGQNTFVGINAGNLSMGSTATANYQSSYNTAVGYASLLANTTGYLNTALGTSALYTNTTGSGNTALGYGGLTVNGTGSYNTASGEYAMRLNTTGSNNTGNGTQALYGNTTGSSNVAIGVYAFGNNTTGNYNTADGVNAGRYIYDGSTSNAVSNNSLFDGYNTMALASGDSNEIVIGSGAIGNGSNSVTLGNTSIATTVLRGNIGIDTSNPTSTLDVVGSVGLLATTTATSTTLSNVGLQVFNGTSAATTTLPLISASQNREYEFKNIGTATDTIMTATSTDFIYGLATSTSYALPAGGHAVTMHNDGQEWEIISTY